MVYVFALFFIAVLFLVVPRIAKWHGSLEKKDKPADHAAIKKFNTDERRIIQHVRSERRNAQSILVNAFRGFMTPLTVLLLIFIGYFYFLDWIYAGLRSFGDADGQKLKFILYAIMDTMMVIMMILKFVMKWTFKKDPGWWSITMTVAFFGSVMNLFVAQGSTGESASANATVGEAVVMKTNNTINDIRADRRTLEDLRSKTRRSPEVILSEITPDKVIARSPRDRQAIWNRTRVKKNGRRVGLGCKDITKAPSQTACARITALRTELKQAINRDRLERELPGRESKYALNPEKLRSNYDVQASNLQAVLARLSIKIDQKTASVIIMQIFAALIALAYTIYSIVYPTALNERIRISDMERREDSDPMLDSIGFIEDETGHIRKVTKEDAAKHAKAVDSATAIELASLKGMIEQKAQPTPTSMTINGMDGLDSSQEIAAVEAFLISSIKDQSSIQDAFRAWKDAGYSQGLVWFAKKAELATLKTNNLTLDGSNIRHSA
jgi:hypothetical protein